MNPDKSHRVSCKAVLEPGEVRQDVDAVDAAIGPEIQHDNFPAQLSLERERWRIEPFLTLGKIRRFQPVRHLVHLFDMLAQLLPEHGRPGLRPGCFFLRSKVRPLWADQRGREKQVNSRQ